MSARCSTSQSDRLKAVFESIRDIISECRLIFYEDRMVFIGSDNGHIMILKYVIIAREIEATGGVYIFDSPEPIKININVKTIAQHLRNASPKDIITFQIDPAIKNRLIIRIHNPDTGKNSTAHIVIPQTIKSGSGSGGEGDECPREEDINVFKWNGFVSMTSAAYHDMIKFVSMAGTDNVRLFCDMRGEGRNRLEMSAEGITTHNMYVVTDKIEGEVEEEDPASKGTKGPASSSGGSGGGGGDTGVFFMTNDTSDTEWPVDSLFRLPFLMRVAKAKSVSTKLKLYVRKNYPAAIVFDARIGILTFIITTTCDDDEMMDPAPMAVAATKSSPIVAAAAAAIPSPFPPTLKRPFIKIEPPSEPELEAEAEPEKKRARLQSESESESSESEEDDD